LCGRGLTRQTQRCQRRVSSLSAHPGNIADVLKREDDMSDATTTATAVRTVDPGAARGAWARVAALAAGAFVIGTGTFVVAGLLTELAADLGVAAGAAGLVASVFALASAVGAPLLGALLAGRRPRVVLVGSLVLFGLFSAASALAPTLDVLLVARVGAALAAAVYVPAAGAAAAAAVPAAHRGRALAVILGGTSGAVIGGAPLGVLLASAYSWRAAFALVAAFALATALALAYATTNAAPAAATVRQRLRPLQSPSLAGVLAVTLLVIAGSNALFTYLELLLGAAGPVGPLIAAFGVGGLLGTWWSGSAADRWGTCRTMQLAAATLVAVGALVPAVASAPAAIALMIAWGAAAWGFVIAVQHRLVGLAVGPPPVVLALNSSAVQLGFAAGALLGGIVVDTAGADRLWLLAVACCAAGLTLYTMLSRKDTT
jgi:predicted MFS family arabinose efflux permease